MAREAWQQTLKQRIKHKADLFYPEIGYATANRAGFDDLDQDEAKVAYVVQ